MSCILRRPKNQKNHWFYKVFGTFFDFFSILDLSWLILAQHGLQDAFKTPPRAPKTPPRAPKTPPRAFKMPPRRSRGRSKSLIFLSFFNGFAFLGLLGTSLTQHGLQDASKTLQDAFKTLHDASQNLQDASKTPPRASRMPPRRSRGTPKSLIFP